ncbi:hypothetical protein MTR_5g035400 [Medicago truncatula]|uniref:Uncharacterized protein n=1 Tax=Medicago truncatula TaxID=3880 RepID=G7K447_MEDTR|nr:hypothetical protein MTR_5g035400 [Medicago truncatula]
MAPANLSSTDDGYTSYEFVTIVHICALQRLCSHPPLYKGDSLQSPRLPTKLNLLHRGIIYADYSVCTPGCGHLETTHHLFLPYSMYGSMWHGVRSWIEISGADPYSISYHLSQFIYYVGGWSKSSSLIFTACMATLGLDYLE